MSDPIPLALFTGAWLPYSETFIYDQILHQQRFATTVYARYRVDDASRFPYDDVVTLPKLERKALERFGRSPSFSSRLKKTDAKLIHAHFGTNGVFAVPFARRLEIPLAVTFHGYDVSALLPQNRDNPEYQRYQSLAPEMFQQATLLLCASQELADILLEVGAPEPKIRVHRLGIDVGRFAVPERPIGPESVLMIGRLVEKKGMEFGIRAFAQVHEQHEDIRLRIVGDGPLREELTALVESLGVASAVEFLGIMGSDEVRTHLQQADVLMAPSVVAANGDRESGVIVLKEAAACGLPCIGTHHGGIPEIINHEQTGFLVPERDAEAIAEHLGTLVEDRDLRLKLGAAARKRMEEQYDTRRQNERLEEHLASML
jgi:glycosyltransferase involved in cell wall biosynthesis